MSDDVTFDTERIERIGLDEAVLADPKSDAQIASIIAGAMDEDRRLLVTRLAPDRLKNLPREQVARLDYCEASHTAILGPVPRPRNTPKIALVSAGTSDFRPLTEARRVLSYAGLGATVISDCGVAGLWRLLRHEKTLRDMDIVIVFAGMDGALPSVVAGLVPGVVISVPTAVGYGVAAGGKAALHATLSSCAPGLLVVNIDNGYGAATAAIRIANTFGHHSEKDT